MKDFNSPKESLTKLLEKYSNHCDLILAKWYQLQKDKIFLDDLEDIIPLEFQKERNVKNEETKE